MSKPTHESIRTMSSARVSLMLYAAALLTALFAAGHTFGTIKLANDSQNVAAREAPVIVEGQSLMLIDVFVGYGYAWTVGLLVQVLMLFLLAAAMRPAEGADGGRLARRIVGCLVLTNLFGSLVALKYLIWVPVAFQAALGLLLGMAWLAMRPRSFRSL